jgi:hypothetical protein
MESNLQGMGICRFAENNVAAEAELQRVLIKIESELRDGIKHGFFELCVTGEVIKEGKRRLIVRAGKSYQFVVSE